MTLTKVNNKLLELNDKYVEIYTKFYIAELAYIQVRAKLMREQYINFASQPTRDAAVEELIANTQEYENYHKLAPEMNIINVQIKIYMQIAKNLNNLSWEVK